MASALGPAVVRRLRVICGRKMTRGGVVVLTARRFRAREANRKDAIERLVELIRRAAVAPKRRRATKPTLGSKRRRLENKRRRGAVKNNRATPGPDD